MIIPFIINQIEELIHNYYALYKAGNLKWGELKKLTEFEFLLDDFIDMCELDPVDKVQLERISTKIADTLRFDKIIFYYSSFHYFFNKIAYNDSYVELSKDIYQMNIQINIVRIQIKHKLVTGCSEDDYFFEGRGTELVRALEILYKKGECENVDYNAVLYLLLNYLQTLLEYIKSGDSNYYISACGLARKCIKILEDYCTTYTRLQSEVKRNIKLKMFIYAVYNDYTSLFLSEEECRWSENVRKIEDSKIYINNIWAARNIYDLDKEYFTYYFEEYLFDYEMIYKSLYEDSKMVYLRCCIRWLKEKQLNKVDGLKLPLLNEKVDKSWFYIDSYIKGYTESASISISKEEVDIVQNYNDEILRKKIANIITNIDRHVINRESVKAHGVFEIADMELPIRKSYGDIYYLCLPVKSGVEIPKKVTEDIAYQVIRPFTYFGNRAIVVFISAKDATESFYNYIKRAKANLNFDIYVIAGDELVKLLKYNGQIEEV